jgi:murein endopeptidase
VVATEDGSRPAHAQRPALAQPATPAPAGTAPAPAQPAATPAQPAPAASATGFEQLEQTLLDAGSVSLGLPHRGALVRGVQLPAEGTDFFTWDIPLKGSPNRPWRRWATGRTIATVLAVISEYRLANPGVPRVGIADLSRPHGGNFGKRFGGLGHASHQNGVDVDILYPRLDFQEVRPTRAAQIHRALSQDLVDRFVAAGARYVFVGPNTRLTGPKKVVQPLVHHDDHMHVRLLARAGGRTG